MRAPTSNGTRSATKSTASSTSKRACFGWDLSDAVSRPTTRRPISTTATTAAMTATSTTRLRVRGRMEVLVTGGAGFIGANFVPRARHPRPEWALTVIDALTYAGNRENLAPVESDIEFVHGNIADADLVDGLVAGADVIVHFAAESHND